MERHKEEKEKTQKELRSKKEEQIAAIPYSRSAPPICIGSGGAIPRRRRAGT
jgi:hypothetical protein